VFLQQFADQAPAFGRAALGLDQAFAHPAAIKVDRHGVRADIFGRIEPPPQHQATVRKGERVEHVLWERILHLARVVQEMGDRVRSPHPPGHIASGHRCAIFGRIPIFALQILGIPRRDGVDIRGKVQQPLQRVAVCGQAEPPAVDVMLALPAIEMAGFCIEGHHAIGVGISPDHAGLVSQQTIAEQIRMQRR